MAVRTFVVVLVAAVLLVIAAVAMHGKNHGLMGELGAAIHGTRR
jgi:hypothetical protein